ncbi:MAG TPA: hypothetical protein VIF40_20235 [Methylosinus sp.]|uniref:hypothetical protein n=1 Tax=Methylosinus sp. TaxID=427 RepID=UPI002F953467
MLFTAARRGDVVALGRQHIRNGVIAWIPEKTKRNRSDPVFVEIVEPLRTAIEAGPAGNLTFLLAEYGAPFSAAGYGWTTLGQASTYVRWANNKRLAAGAVRLIGETACEQSVPLGGTDAVPLDGTD